MLACLLVLFAFPATCAAGNGAAGHLRYATDAAAASADFRRTPARSRFVILHEWEAPKAAALKAANPRLKVLMYKNLSFIQAADARGNSGAGVTAQDAAGHDDWYLLDAAGERFTSWTYDYLHAADVGNAAYRRRWADNVLARLHAGPWDGVLVDDVSPTIKYHHRVADVAKYPTDAAYAAVTGGALAEIAPRIAAAGKLVIPNFGAWHEYRDVVDPWLAYVDGAMEESFTKWGRRAGEGWVTGEGWEARLGALKVAAAARKEYLAVSHGPATDDAAARYGYATVLLGGEGMASFSHHSDYTNESWFPEYELPIGTPVADEVEEASGVHRRPFSNGLVLVNPTDRAVTVALGGTYSGSGLAGATSATMTPHTGLVLVRTTSG